ncbi:MAG: P-II family nitrogen regulator [Gammaproteobacteria bacterium]|nr:P-II family nitrogen regulator [Gammaproteobacteria bacterium]
MNYRKVTAIIPSMSLDETEQALLAIGVKGMTITKVHGLGEYRNYYSRDNLSDCGRIEIFTEQENARHIAETIARTVHQGLSSDGVIAILPVEDFIHISEFEEVSHDG